MEDYLDEKSVENPDPIIRLFSLCEGMKWSHLPVAGGIYDQHPALMDGFQIIFQTRARIEAKKAEIEERKNRANGSRVAGRR